MSIIFLRHAKSCWDDPHLDDWARPLTSKGINALPLVIEQLQQWGVVPTKIICSDSVRTMTTAKAVAAAFPDAQLQPLPQLYLATVEQWQLLLQQHQVNHNLQQPCQIWVGHNPGLCQLVEQLSQLSLKKFPTAAMAWIEGDNVKLYRAQQKT